tara:strand:- start:609 stop:1109 length:501 start_codon:yes stop_codon:yes gene_type:complete
MEFKEEQPILDAPIPGMAMTHELGARPWQTAPQYTTVDEAIEYYMSRMSTEDFMEQSVAVLEMGIPVTTIANTMQMASVMEGKHSVDVGMLVIPLIMEMLMVIGDNADIEYDDGLTEIKSDEVSDAALEKIRREMEKRVDAVEDEVETEEDEPEIEESIGLMARRV